MSNGSDARGPWNSGQGPWSTGKYWPYVENPVRRSIETNGALNVMPEGNGKFEAELQDLEKQLSERRRPEIRGHIPTGPSQWSSYPQTDLNSPMGTAGPVGTAE